MPVDRRTACLLGRLFTVRKAKPSWIFLALRASDAFVTYMKVGADYVASLTKPGANITGFAVFESGTAGKWLQFLEEIAPSVTRAAILRDPTLPVGIGHLAAIQSVAPSLQIETNPSDVREASEIQHAIEDCARNPAGAWLWLRRRGLL
jgi:ABC-type uncharacterized transport system substrate-binding protein